MRSTIVVAALLVVAGWSPALAQTRVVTGRVTDSLTSEVVTSGQVSVAGTTVGSTIKEDGTFTLAVPVRDVTISVRSIGFKRKDVNVPAAQSSADVSLARDYFQLEAIVVTGQATGVERKNLANAVATVSAAQLGAVPAQSLDQQLNGKLTGAYINNSSGAPGSTARVTLRGITTINGGNTPLYVVDGVIASDISIPRGTNFVTQASRGQVISRTGENSITRIADLNPDDIENVEVLQGASAAAIYGSKASNGVIIITTKRGRVSAPQFNVVQRLGTTEAMYYRGSRVFQSLADAQAVYGAAKATDPVTGWAAGKQFDNEKTLIGNKPLNYETSASMNGGTESTQYFASLLVNHSGGIISNTYADKRSLRLNVDQSAGSRVKIQLGSEVSNSANDQGLTINENNNSSLYASLANTPNFFDMRGTCPGGATTTAAICSDGSTAIYKNPYVASNALQTAARLKNREYVWRMIGTGRLGIDAITSARQTLRLSVNGGADYFTQNDEVFSPPDLLFEPLDGLLGTTVASNSGNLNFNVNTNIVHTFKSAGTSFTTQLGTQYENRELKINRVLNANLVGGLQVVTSGTAPLIDARHEFVKDVGFFGQEEFLGLGERLLLTLGLRADQSSNNGDPNKLFYYPKAAASFRFPNIARGVLDEVKLRAAFGESGNQPLYGQKYTELLGLNVAGTPAAQIQNSSAAANIVPERQAEFEAGLDANMLGGRLNLVATGYQKRITDLLLSRTLPSSFGFTSEFLNGGIMTTRGMELSLDGLPVQTKSFSWSGRFGFSMFRSQIDSLPVPKFGGCGFGGGSVRIEQGGSATSVYGFDTAGYNGAKTCVKIGETRPDYQMQFSSDLRFHALRFTFLFDRAKGGLISDLTGWLYDLDGNSPDYDQAAPDGSGRKLGLYRVQTFQNVSNIYVQDASYLKLREATLTLDLPSAAVHRVWNGARYARVSLSGRNLLDIKSYKGSDPEARWVAEQSLAQALPQELWAYPPSRSFWFSVDVGF